MRLATLMALALLVVFVGRAAANGTVQNLPKPISLTITNKCDGAIAVSVQGSPLATLEPRQSVIYNQPAYKGSQVVVKVIATLVGAGVTTSNSATLRAEQKATATITAPTKSSLAINFSGPALVVANYREAGLLLASSGGLLPLFALTMLLGRPSRRRN
jgi:hypothetical protein